MADLTAAKDNLCKLSQLESFADEFHCLSNDLPLPKRSRLIPLRPTIENGLIRIGGRIGLAHIPYESKHQIILSQNHHVSRLIALDYHEANSHVGSNSPFALI